MGEDFESGSPVSDDELADYGARLESLPLDDAVWVARLLRECLRARSAEASGQGKSVAPSAAIKVMEHDIAQVVLDAAEWLQTLWHVGYMGAGRFPSEPRTAFPAIDADDILKSALLARIRQGRRPLPFPPPTRNGMPWHEIVESDEMFVVEAQIIRDDFGWVGVVIDGCSDWVILEEVEFDRVCRVQHQRKGPVYALTLNSFCTQLQRLPPTKVCRLIVQDRAGFKNYSLEWAADFVPLRMIGLRAMTWERAEIEALNWIASHHPELYGQVRLDRAE